jgi:predicted enzyme related to lactoylglutathione lyase
VDEVAERVAAAGHTVAHPPFDAPWGQRYAVADPDGYRVDLFAPLPAG